ncbi:flavin reductase family protein [Streptomyces sp. NPDC059893]|uniref:flavin reductase family protein n=1 Tax=Streptomyces sp. NPDC059893 TaxID=3346990 RepID=UPI0036647559
MSFEAKTASKASVNFASLSRIRNYLVNAVVECHEKVAGLLGRPASGWVGGDAEKVDPAGGDLHDHHAVQAPKQNGVNVEEVHRDDPGSLTAQELRPGRAVAAGCRVDPCLVQDRPYRGGSDRAAQAGQFARSCGSPRLGSCGHSQSTSLTWPTLRQRRRLGISVLARDHDLACRTLASTSGNRFADVDWTPTDDGAVFIGGSAACLGCSVHASFPAGDHTIVVLDVHTAHADTGTSPLAFHGSRFRRLTANDEANV